MFLVKPSYFVRSLDGVEILHRIEAAGRTCYKSEGMITVDSAKEFVRKILKRGHESVIEHESISVRFIVDRGVTHELVRHRLASYSQESTRYCNYKGGVTFIIPPWVDIEEGDYRGGLTATIADGPATDYHWFLGIWEADGRYGSLLENGWTPQQARSVLPNSLKTEIVCTANIREWRHILRLRTAKAAHPQMREIMIPLLIELREQIPILFDDVGDIEC